MSTVQNVTVNGYPSVYQLIMPLPVSWAIDRYDRGISTEIDGDSITVYKAGGRS